MAPPNELLAAYPVVIALPIQWGDQDALGHVNNVVYFRWFESARIAYLSRINLHEKSPPNVVGPILAAVSCNFRRQLFFPDTIHVGTKLERIGRSSLTMQHCLVSENLGAVAAEGQSTVVAFDYTANQPRPIPDAMRTAIESLERGKGS